MNPLERVAAWGNETPSPARPPASSNGHNFDLPGFFVRHQLHVRKEKAFLGGGTLYELRTCPFDASHVDGSAAIAQMPDGALVFKCLHNSCKEKGWKDLRAHLEPEYRARQNGTYGSGQKATSGQAESAGSQLVTRCVADIQAKPISWLWPDRIARGKLTLIGGHPGKGKSQVTVSVAAVVTTGGKWPVTREQCEPGQALFLSAEDTPEDTLRPRLEAAGAKLSLVHVIDGVIRGYAGDGTRQERMFSLAEDLRALDLKLTELGNVAAVIIDPISAYLGKADSHKNAEVRSQLAPLSELAARHNVAIIAITHLNKVGTGRALMRFIDSVAFVAAARSAYLVADDPADKDRRLFLPAKINLAKDQEGLAFRIEGSAVDSPVGQIQTSRVMWESSPVTVTADEAMQADTTKPRCTAVDEAAEWLREILANGAISASEVIDLAKGEGISEKTLRRAQKNLGIRPTKEGLRRGLGMGAPIEDGQKFPRWPIFCAHKRWPSSTKLAIFGAGRRRGQPIF
jgi:putative DNA primase/helicase